MGTTGEQTGPFASGLSPCASRRVSARISAYRPRLGAYRLLCVSLRILCVWVRIGAYPLPVQTPVSVTGVHVPWPMLRRRSHAAAAAAAAAAAGTPLDESRPPRPHRRSVVRAVASVLAGCLGCHVVGTNVAMAEDASFRLSLRPIRRVKRADLDLDTFHREHVLPAIPVIIELDPPSDTRLWDENATLTECGEQRISLLSEALREGLQVDLGPLLRVLFSALLWLATGDGLEAWRTTRDSLTLEEFVHVLRVADASSASVYAVLVPP